MQNQLKNIRHLSLDELRNFFELNREKPFRAKQVYEWLWQKSAGSFDEMTNISLPLRQMLQENFSINNVRISNQQKSSDGTIKNGLELFDKNIVEAVLIPTPTRMTACVSSQVGCSLTCRFCATGKMERIRNLYADEIYDQVVLLRKQSLAEYGIPLTNIVYMGMGEPLLNYGNVIKSIEMITSPEGLGMAAKRITLSTAGIAKMIKKLADDEVKVNLALSLHAADDEKRNKIMPINEHNSLDVLSEALRYYVKKTGLKVTFEYIVFANFNDNPEDAINLAKFGSNISSKINLIEYNPIDGAEFSGASWQRLEAFQNLLEQKKFNVHIRRSRGKDIDAACGQLANKSVIKN